MAIPLYHVPRVKGERGADMMRMMAGSSVTILFGPIRTGEPEMVESSAISRYEWSYHILVEHLQLRDTCGHPRCI